MHLPKEDVELFYKLHSVLLQYVNETLQILPNIKTSKALKDSGVENVAKVRDMLWGRSKFIDEFVSKNPAGFSREELAIVIEWKYAVHDSFFIVRHLRKHTVFLTAEGPVRAYGVRSLETPLAEMFSDVPVYVNAALIPFRRKITYDGILRLSPVIFGSGIRRDLTKEYQNIKIQSKIIEVIETS